MNYKKKTTGKYIEIYRRIRKAMPPPESVEEDKRGKIKKIQDKKEMQKYYGRRRKSKCEEEDNDS